jgi:hypothetical protein
MKVPNFKLSAKGDEFQTILVQENILIINVYSQLPKISMRPPDVGEVVAIAVIEGAKKRKKR